MGANTAIPWAHHTFNPWWGCVKKRAGCTNCYASAFDHRFGGDHWGPDARRRFFGDAHWNKPRAWDRKAAKAGERRRVFCGSMCDVFEQLPTGHPDYFAMYEARMHLWLLIARTPNLDWLLLTKRAENISNMLSSQYLPNVWLGVTTENQAAADEQIPLLLDVPAAVWFVSYEPAIGPLDLQFERGYLLPSDPALRRTPRIDWVIAGAESATDARPMNEDWVRDLRDQCTESVTPFFYKQRIDDGRKIEMPELDGKVWAEFPELK